MNEIYWITRVGVIGDMCMVISVVGIIILVVVAVFTPIWIGEFDEQTESNKRWMKKFFKRLFIVWVCGIIGVLIIPSQKEMMLIYGLGGTIDYVKSNDKAKQLPDKVVDALTRYVDQISKEDNK